jgi:NAD dependent epimerase/dehydratase family enzyme
VPAAALKLVAGDFASDILGGQNVLPRRLLDAGFTFQHTMIDQGIGAALR